MQDGFIRVAAASPAIKVADCAHNAAQIIGAAHEAAQTGAKLLVLPELCITGYTCGDLFLQDVLLQDAMDALKAVCDGTRGLDMLLAVGLPLRHHGKLYNCAAVLLRGHVLGLVPKSYPPNYSEFYELRHFTPGFSGLQQFESGFLRGLPIGTQLLFTCEQLPAFTLAVEICEDLWVPAPPSILHAAAGATVIANLSASNETVGKAEWRRSLVQSQSGRLVCGYVYADAGYSESTTDLVFASHNLIAENGALLAQSPLFSGGAAVSEIDVERLSHDRQRITSYPDSGAERYHTVYYAMNIAETPLSREISPTPFLPTGDADMAERCETILAIQAAGLKTRLDHIGAKTAVLGISGGLDSSLALLVTARAFRNLGLPFEGITAVTMPGFGTTSRTRSNAEKLCKALGVNVETIDISATTRSHFDDIGHSEDNHDVVYENAQARVRTLTLMDIANQRGGIVVGTGDLSELALGWATYNGDHMSMYGVNASVPKTLLRHLIAYEAATRPELAPVLRDILDTPVSPELLPPENGEISQQTESIVGPYELHDFFLYYVLRWGFAPKKVLRLALIAFQGRYDKDTILTWMKTFYRRFFSQQFKRSCLPDGPKVGSVTLSPRGDWRMPSDASASGWLRQLDTL